MRTSLFRLHFSAVLLLGAAGLLSPGIVSAQALTGALIGAVKDAEGGVLRGALARLTSSALIGGQVTLTTNEKGQLRFPILPPGDYALDIELQGFHSYHETQIRIGAGATLERTVVLHLAGVARFLRPMPSASGAIPTISPTHEDCCRTTGRTSFE